MSEWEPATDAEVAMRDALRTDDQETYFRILSGVDLLLPVSADALAGLAPLGWGTWSTGGRTHVLAFTSTAALQACLADYTGSARRVPYGELANTWPNLEWWLAVNPGLPIEGYLPAWFVAQLSRGDLRLPTRGPGKSQTSTRLQDLQSAAVAANTAVLRQDEAGGPTHENGRAAAAPGAYASQPPSAFGRLGPGQASAPPYGQSAPDQAGAPPYGQSAPGQASAPPYGQPAPGQTSAPPYGQSAPGQAGAPPFGQPAPGQASAPPFGQPAPGQASAPPFGQSAPGQASAPPYGQSAPDQGGAPPYERSAPGQAGAPPYGQSAPGQGGALPLRRPSPGQAGAPSAAGQAGAPSAAGQAGAPPAPYGRPAGVPPAGAPPAAYRRPGLPDQVSAPPAAYGPQPASAPPASQASAPPAPAGAPPAAYGTNPTSAPPAGLVHPTSAPPASYAPQAGGVPAGYAQAAAGYAASQQERPIDAKPPQLGPGGLPIRTPGAVLPSGLPSRNPAGGPAALSGPAALPGPAALSGPPAQVPDPASGPAAVPPAYQSPSVPLAYQPPSVPPAYRTPSVPAEAAGWSGDDPSGPAQDPSGPLPVRTPMANTPPLPDHLTPQDPEETPFDPQWSSQAATALPRRTPSSVPAADEAAGVPQSTAAPQPAGFGSPLPRRQAGPATEPAPLTSFPAFKTPAERAVTAQAAASAPAPPVIPGSPGSDRVARLGAAPPLEVRPVAPATPPPPPFTPAGEVERELFEAADAGLTDQFLSTLLLATVLVPVAHHSRPGSAPGESGFAFRTEEMDGERYLIVFTSKDRLAEHYAEPTRTVSVRFYELIRNWPDPAWSFAVNPGTPVGAKYPGPQVIALASWAAEAGLGADPADHPAEETEEPIPAPAPAHDDAQHATVMQKTLPPEQVDYYLERGYDRVAGFVHRATEVEHLRTPAELFGALGLTYEGSPHLPDAKEAYVLRWPAYRPSLYRIPYGGQNEQALRAMDGWVIERAPFRGNGFAPGEGRDVVAEFKVDSVRLPHGAQLWRIDPDGADHMVAIFDNDGPQWRRVGEQ